MGWIKLLLNVYNAEGCRETMRLSYQKHFRLARQSLKNDVDIIPYHVGLYGALGSRYKKRGKPVTEISIWAELVPFILMKEKDAIEALAEYVVYQERPGEAKISWLRKVINDTLRTASISEKLQKLMASIGFLNQFIWFKLLDKDVKSRLEDEVLTEMKAKELLIEVSQLVKSAQEVETRSYSDALKLYEKALALIIRQSKMKADAEESPLGCALLIAKTIENPQDKAEALVEIAGKYTEAGQRDRAYEILLQAFEVAKTIEGKDHPEDKDFVLSAIAGQFAEVGQYGQALQVAKAMDFHSKFLGFIEIARTCAKVGQYIQALQVANNIEDLAEKAQVLTEIARTYAEIGQYDQGLQVARIIEINKDKAERLLDIACMHSQAGQKDKAFEILLEALQVANIIEDLTDKTKVLSWVGRTFNEIGQYEEAFQVAKLIENSDTKAWLLFNTVYHLAEVGQYENALRIVKSIEVASYKVKALAEIADKYAKVEQKVDNGARKILQEIVRDVE